MVEMPVCLVRVNGKTCSILDRKRQWSLNLALLRLYAGKDSYHRDKKSRLSVLLPLRCGNPTEGSLRFFTTQSTGNLDHNLRQGGGARQQLWRKGTKPRHWAAGELDKLLLDGLRCGAHENPSFSTGSHHRKPQGVCSPSCFSPH